MFSLIFIFLLYMGLYYFYDKKRRDRYKVTYGTIRKYEESGGILKKYRPVIMYEVNGELYTITHYKFSFFKRITPRIRLYYLADNPEISYVAPTSPLIVFGVVGFIIFCFYLFIFSYIFRH